MKAVGFVVFLVIVASLIESTPANSNLQSLVRQVRQEEPEVPTIDTSDPRYCIGVDNVCTGVTQEPWIWIDPNGDQNGQREHDQVMNEE